MKKLLTIMIVSILMAACNNEAATEPTTESADTISTAPVTVDTLSSDTTARLNADSAIRK